MTSIGQRLKSLRRAKGLTQQKLADALGVERSTYAKYEINKNEPDYAMIKVLAKFHGVDEKYIIYGEEKAAERGPLSSVPFFHQEGAPGNSEEEEAFIERLAQRIKEKLDREKT